MRGKCSSAVQLKGGEGKQARRFRALPIGTSVLSLQLYFLSQNFLTYQYLTICLLLLLFHLTPKELPVFRFQLGITVSAGPGHAVAIKLRVEFLQGGGPLTVISLGMA